jgi:hypothetical protein
MSLLDVVAVLGVRNEEVCLGNALRHLKANGIKYAVIDNGSDDDTPAIIRRREFSSHLVTRRDLPYLGEHDLQGMLREKMALIEALKTDWVIHMDADEVMHSAQSGETLQEEISRFDQEGYDAIDFNEFVFLPLEHSYVRERVGFQPITTYYFYSPRPLRLMRAWKPGAGYSMVHSGGHSLAGSTIHLAPQKLIMRHYIFRDQEHAFTKYAARQFKPSELAMGWHWNRHGQPVRRFKFPLTDRLQMLDQPDSYELRMHDPKSAHYWMW